MPPVTRAEANRATAPSTKPNPRPNTRPARMSRNHSGSKPSIPGLAIRKAEKQAARMPSSAIALASMPPSESSAITMAISRGTSATNTHGASPLCAVFWPALWWISKGQQNATMPKMVVTPRRNDERWPSRMAGTW